MRRMGIALAVVAVAAAGVAAICKSAFADGSSYNMSAVFPVTQTPSYCQTSRPLYWCDLSSGLCKEDGLLDCYQICWDNKGHNIANPSSAVQVACIGGSQSGW